MEEEYKSLLSNNLAVHLNKVLSQDDASVVIKNAKEIEEKMMPVYFLFEDCVMDNGVIQLIFNPRRHHASVELDITIEVGITKYTALHELIINDSYPPLNFVVAGSVGLFPEQWR